MNRIAKSKLSFQTCPITRRKNTPQCAKIFSAMANTAPLNQQNMTPEKYDEVLNHFHHVFMPTVHVKPHRGWPIRHKYTRRIVKKPIYNYGLLNSRNAPPVRIINVKPTVQKPLILVPVYMRVPHNANIFLEPHVNNGVLRSSPFWLHNQIAMAHANVTNSTLTTPTPVSNNTPISSNPPISSSPPISFSPRISQNLPISLDTTVSTSTSVSTGNSDDTVSPTTEDFQQIFVP